MTTKYKIILGFASMVFIMFAIAVMGYQSLDASRNGLSDYRRFAYMNVGLSDAMSHLNSVGRAVNQFLFTRDEAAMKEAVNALAELEACIVSAEKI